MKFILKYSVSEKFFGIIFQTKLLLRLSDTSMCRTVFKIIPKNFSETLYIGLSFLLFSAQVYAVNPISSVNIPDKTSRLMVSNEEIGEYVLLDPSRVKSVLTVAGSYYSGDRPPLLSVSTDRGSTWTSVTGLATSGAFYGTSCTGSGSSAICTAAGQDFTGSSPPLLVVSNDGGSTWAVKSVTGLPTFGSFNSTSCTDSGPSAICTAAGIDNTSFSPLLVVSTDGGKTWAVASVTDLPTSGYFISTSCTGKKPSAICTAVGKDRRTGFPLLVVSTDLGSTWAVKSVTGLPGFGIFLGTSCTGSGSSAFCTAAGTNSTGSQPPLLVVSTDGGNTWAVASVNGLPTFGSFNSTSCTGSESSAICTAAGIDNTSASPLLVVSTDGGSTWIVKSVTGLSTSGSFYGTSCTGSGPSAICTAVGEDFTGSHLPLVAVSTDGGNTWTVKSVTGLPTNGYFRSTSCTGSGPSAICTAAWQDFTRNSPFVAHSTDGGRTWAVAAFPNLLPKGEIFGTGGSGSSFSSPNNSHGFRKFGSKHATGHLMSN